MPSTADEHLNDWLRDAHAMEQQSEKTLQGQAERLEHYPELRARIVQHLEETRGQLRMIDECLSRCGVSNSVMKDVGGKLTAFGQGLAGVVSSDEVVKGAMSGYVLENVEIASYTSLIAAADAVGDSATRSVCEQILEQEKAMAVWMLHHIPDVTKAFLARAETPGAEAKV